MSLKKKLFNFLAAIVLMISSIPATAMSAFAADTNTTETETTVTPQHSKTIKSNGDGTYTISLRVAGAGEQTTETTNANVVVIFDTSGSMTEDTSSCKTTGWWGGCASYYSRLEVAKESVNSLAQNLLNNNTSDHNDLVKISLVDFATNVKSTLAPTTSYSTFSSAVNSLTANGGTNWEGALKAAQDVDFGARENATTYYIFVSDGDPTFRDSKYSDRANDYNERYGVWGTGNSDQNSWNYNAAKAVADSIKQTNGSELYAIGVFGNVTRMEGIGGDNYYSASNQAALEAAFSEIADAITNSLTITNVVMNDGVTDMTSVAPVDGNAGGFKYRISTSTEADNIWTDAPKAEIETVDGVKTVVWNLGATELSKNQWAEVSFIVWPSQEAYDLVADLNNGKRTYDELSETEKKEIKYNEAAGEWSLRTNTDNPTISYTVKTTTVDKEGNETVTTQNGEATFENPDPVDLAEKKLTVRKIWADEMDGGEQRQEEVDSVVLNLWRETFNEDGTVKEKIIRKTYTLSDDNDWTGEKFALAPGILVSEEHEAYALSERKVSFEGKSYAILDEGHRYWFEEENINSHFELEEVVYHPMLVDGALKNVVFTRSGENNESGVITGIQSMGELNELSATNTLKGGINITKEVLKNGEVWEDSTEAFEIKFSMNDKNGEAYDGIDYRIYYGKNNPCYKTKCDNVSDEDFAKHRSGHIYNDGEFTEEIYAGDVIRVVNIESGAKYKVEELGLNDMPAGYSFGDIEYKIARASRDENTAIEITNDTTGEYKDGDFYVVYGNSASFVKITNNYDTGKLVIKKNVELASDKLTPATSEFEFVLTVDGEETNYTLKDGEDTGEIELPVGAEYSVSEKDYSNVGFTTTSENASGTISKGETVTSTFTNTYNVSPKNVEVKVAKAGFDDFWLNVEHLKGQEFEFCIRETDECQTVNATKKFATFTRTYSEPTTESFTVYEKTDNFLTGVFKKDTEDISVSISITDDGYGKLSSFVSKRKGETTYAVDEDAEIENSYEALPTDEVVVNLRKVINDISGDAEDATFRFRVEDFEGEQYILEITTEELEGEAELLNMSFDAEGEYGFYVKEINEQLEYFEYDIQEHFVLVVVEDVEGQLTATIYVDDEEADELVITNNWNKVDGRGEVEEPTTPNTGSLTLEKQGGSFSSYVSTIILVAIMLGTFVIFSRGRRNEVEKVANYDIISSNEQKVQRQQSYEVRAGKVLGRGDSQNLVQDTRGSRGGGANC